MQSLLLLQSPSNGPQGCEVEQHDHESVVQSHPEKVSINKKGCVSTSLFHPISFRFPNLILNMDYNIHSALGGQVRVDLVAAIHDNHLIQ